MKHFILFSLMALGVATTFAFAAEDLTVLGPGPDGVAPGKQLELWLKAECYRQVERRSAAFETMLKSARACRAWQEERKAFFLRQIGGLPQRTPLHPQIVGTLRGKGYRVEKLLLETRPGFHLTANLYLPDTRPPWPAVLAPCGHSHDGKATGQYQRACILLAKQGLAAICYDPIGQGERYQILDRSRKRTAFDEAPHVPTPHPHVRFPCTIEHTLMAIGSALLGANVAQFRIWDGMRVIDYLQSRPDIRADKIGCTGNSGGGTETAYLMALDQRIAAAAPGCYLTTFRRLIDGKGPQDGEQNIAAQLAFGMDEADYCIMRAPRPTLICAGTRDATFDFRGTWELFLDAKRFYSRLGYAERMEINAPDAPHGFTLQQREAVVGWMSRWLLGKEVEVREVPTLPDVVSDEQLRAYNQPDWSADELRCTPAGQVLLLPGERSVFEINAQAAAKLRAERATRFSALDAAGQRRVVCATLGLSDRGGPAARAVEEVGRIERGGYTIHKLVLPIEPGLRLPGLAFVPRQPRGPATLYLHGASMKHDAAPGGPIETLVREGQIVLAAELRGIGETESGHDSPNFGKGRFGPDLREVLLAYLLGKSYVGLRTEDVRHWTRVLQGYAPAGRKPTAIRLVALGEAALPALHAAALDSEAYERVALRHMLPSWEALVAAPETYDQLVNVVHGALAHYDLSDLVALAGPQRVTITEPADLRGALNEQR